MHSQPSGDPIVGTTVAGRYKVIKLLGEGGMGQVYLAEHFAIEKRVALKVLRAEYAHKGEIVTRFQQEAISASRIKHPNVLDVFDFGQLENGCFYLAMEFLEGNDLADELQRQRVLTAPRALPIAMQICRALSAAHAKGVVHRDMKPENVFLQRTADGEEIVNIVDLGIAQLKSSKEEAAAADTRTPRKRKTSAAPRRCRQSRTIPSTASEPKRRPVPGWMKEKKENRSQVLWTRKRRPGRKARGMNLSS